MSALIADGPPARILEEPIRGAVELVLPEFVLAELERVLLEKLSWDEARVREARELLTELATEIPGSPKTTESLTEDPADDVILAGAVEAEVDVLVTGDVKHLLPLGEHRGVRVLRPQAVLAVLRRLD